MWQRITRMNGKVTIVLAAAVFSVGTAGYVSTAGRDQFHWAFAPLAVTAPVQAAPEPLVLEWPAPLAAATVEPTVEAEPATPEVTITEAPVARLASNPTPERGGVVAASDAGDVVPVTSTAVPYYRSWPQPGPVYHAPNYPPPSFVPPPMAEPEVTPPPSPTPERTPLAPSLDYGVSPTPVSSVPATQAAQLTAVEEATPTPVVVAATAPKSDPAPAISVRIKGNAKAARR